MLLTGCLHLSKGQLVDVEGRLQTRQWDDDAGKRHWKTEVVVASLAMLSGRSNKEYAKEAEAAAGAPDAPAALLVERITEHVSLGSPRSTPQRIGWDA